MKRIGTTEDGSVIVVLRQSSLIAITRKIIEMRRFADYLADLIGDEALLAPPSKVLAGEKKEEQKPVKDKPKKTPKKKTKHQAKPDGKLPTGPYPTFVSAIESLMSSDPMTTTEICDAYVKAFGVPKAMSGIATSRIGQALADHRNYFERVARATYKLKNSRLPGNVKKKEDVSALSDDEVNQRMREAAASGRPDPEARKEYIRRSLKV